MALRRFVGELALAPVLIGMRVAALVLVEIQEGLDTLDARLAAIEDRL